MSIKVLVDMNLSPEWVSALMGEGVGAVHWSTVGDPRAPDTAIMAWALVHQCTVLTHDLDFGTVLALTHASGPSVLQIRGRNVLPERAAARIGATLRRYSNELAKGALIVVDERRNRLRFLPLQ